MRRAMVLIIFGVPCVFALVGSSADGDLDLEKIILPGSEGSVQILSAANDQILVKFADQVDAGHVERLFQSLPVKSFTGESVREMVAGGIGILNVDSGACSSVIAQLGEVDGIEGVLPSYFDDGGSRRYVDPRWILVKFRESVSEAEALGLISQSRCEVAKDFYIHNLYALDVQTDETVFDAVSRLSSLPQVKYAELYEYGLSDDFRDEYTYSMWHLYNEGQFGWLPGHDIHAFPAWTITMGSSDVVVVIIDTGIELEHPDLDDNILDRGDEDWDFSSDESDEPIDANGHGTAVAGLVAAEFNDIGVTGVCPDCKIMPLKIHTAQTPDAYVERANAIQYAVDHKSGVNGVTFDGMVICCAWTTPERQNCIVEACDNAYAAGIPMIFPAGAAQDEYNVVPVKFPA